MADEPYEKKGLSANWAVHEVDHLFSKISGYTRLVRFGKWILFAVAAAIILSLVAVPLLSKDRSGIRVSFVDNGEKNKPATSPIMNSPEYLGTGNKGEQYKVNGIRATQVNPTLVVIDQVEGQLLMGNGGWKSLTAVRGDYHQDKKILDLFGDVTVIDDQGYSFVTQTAEVDTNTMDVTGHETITGVGPMGNLLASGFEIRDSGKHIIFVGSADRQVHTHIDRTKKPAK